MKYSNNKNPEELPQEKKIDKINIFEKNNEKRIVEDDKIIIEEKEKNDEPEKKIDINIYFKNF